jgi:hypothetical protein
MFCCLRFEVSFLSPPTTRRDTVEIFDPASTRVLSSLQECTLFYICLAYRIEDTESNISTLRCHENDPFFCRANKYLPSHCNGNLLLYPMPRDVFESSSVVAWRASTHSLCRKRLPTFPGNTLTSHRAFDDVETCSNNSPPMQWIHMLHCSLLKALRPE